MNFDIKNLWSINIGGVDIWITITILNTWIIMLVLIVLAIIVRVRLKSFTEIPTGFQNAVELLVEFFDKIVKGSAGENRMYLGNWFFMVFAFIFASSVSGLVGLRPPTSDWATTFAFAMATFTLIQAAGVIHRKGDYLKSFIKPNPAFLLLNVMGELSKPISLSFRLFGNILAGMILITMVYALAPIYLRFVLPSALHAFFDIFYGALQTYIFCVLSLTFIGAASMTDN